MLSLIGHYSKADTLSYWHVYLNDSLIAQFHENSQDKIITLSHTSIEPIDTIYIRFFRDTDCDCSGNLYVKQCMMSGNLYEQKIEGGITQIMYVPLNTFTTDSHKSNCYIFRYWAYRNTGLVAMSDILQVSSELFQLNFEE